MFAFPLYPTVSLLLVIHITFPPSPRCGKLLRLFHLSLSFWFCYFFLLFLSLFHALSWAAYATAHQYHGSVERKCTVSAHNLEHSICNGNKKQNRQILLQSYSLKWDHIACVFISFICLLFPQQFSLFIVRHCTHSHEKAEYRQNISRHTSISHRR